MKALRFDVTDVFEHDNDAVVICDIRLWHRTYSDVPDEETEAAFSATSLPVSLLALAEFRCTVEAWLALPPAEQIDTPLVASVSLTPDWEPSALGIDVCPRTDVISERHPVATVRYSVGSLSGELAMVADQSCWRRFCDQSGLLTTNAA